MNQSDAALADYDLDRRDEEETEQESPRQDAHVEESAKRVPVSRMNKKQLQEHVARLEAANREKDEQNATLQEALSEAVVDDVSAPDPMPGEQPAAGSSHGYEDQPWASGAEYPERIDPKTGNRLRPPLTPEQQAEEDARIKAEYEDMLGGPQNTPVNPIKTQRAARDDPRIIRRGMETDERDTGLHGKSTEFLDTPVDEDPKLTEHAVDVDVIAMKKWSENIEFMKQMVTIHIGQQMHKDDDKLFSIGVNGRFWTFERNTEYTVPRYVVEGLLRAKPMQYGNEEYTKSNGERAFRYPISQGVRYPFSIIQDPYPRWREWMRFTMAQPD